MPFAGALAAGLGAMIQGIPAHAADGGLATVDPAEFDAVVLALSARDGAACDAVEALTATPVPALLAVVDTVARPSYAPMRAADCLVTRHAAEVRASIEAWVVSPELLGLGRLVLSRIDAMPVDVAVPVVRKALTEGPQVELAAKRASASAVAEIRALVPAQPAASPVTP